MEHHLRATGWNLPLWHHTALPATRHKWTDRLVLDLHVPTSKGWKTELTYSALPGVCTYFLRQLHRKMCDNLYLTAHPQTFTSHIIGFHYLFDLIFFLNHSKLIQANFLTVCCRLLPFDRSIFAELFQVRPDFREVNVPGNCWTWTATFTDRMPLLRRRSLHQDNVYFVGPRKKENEICHNSRDDWLPAPCPLWVQILNKMPCYRRQDRTMRLPTSPS